MENKFYNREKLISFRRDIHKHPEGSYMEFRTASKIIEYLEEIGISQTQIRKVAKTGFIVDIPGKAPKSGQPSCIAIRAEMDALPMKENNPHLEFSSTTDHAHTCGHDTHITVLVATVAKIADVLDKIPSDKVLRCLFQPAEETIGGAFNMIQEGALDGVDEVYGLHNIPFEKVGKVLVQTGPMMASLTDIDVIIHGKGGHAADPETIDPLQPALDIEYELKKLVELYREKGHKLTCSLPYVRTNGDSERVSDTCILRGMFRAFSDETIIAFKTDMQKMFETIAKKHKCKAEIALVTNFPAVENTPRETENFIKIAKQVVGEENVSDSGLPFYASEDFSYFLRHRPGCLFMPSSGNKPGGFLHTDIFEPDEDYIFVCVEIYYKLLQNRFGINLD